MKMRMWYIALLSLLALTACQQEPVLSEGGNGNSFDPSRLSYNITIGHPDRATTKGVKKEWEKGDKVFLFIQGITTGYLTATLKETSWETTYEGTADPASLEATGILHAVYLPYGNDATPSYQDGQWTFSSGTDTYYFIACGINYKVSSGVLSATVQMINPGEYVQFFIPCTGASGTIQLACNGFRPAGFARIDPDTGTVTENLGNAGEAVQGYPDTLEGEEGYYVSGKQTAVNDNDYYFALQKADGSYAHYFKRRTQAMADNKAYKLPAYSSWKGVGGNLCVQIAGERWKTVNEGATHPWEMGTLTYSFEPAEGKGVPTADNWDALLDPDVADWKEMDIMGQKGYLVVSKNTPTNYIFLPWSTETATDYWIDEFGSVVRIAADGTQSNEVTPAPAVAYARMLEKVNYFRIKAKEGGTTMTFKYTDGSIEYSEDQGGLWATYEGKTFNLGAGDEVWFRGNRSDCNCTGNTQLFKANHVCYIAGDITTLLADPATLPANAFRSAFSCGEISDSDAEKEKNLPAASGTVDWVDIDPNDPLILPVSTAANCYLEMFMGCTSLTSAPDLPATELKDKCYFRMFYKCSGLTSVPSFPSVVTMSGTRTERRYCYQMFQNCTGIERLTEPLFVGQNSTMARGCFEDMFAHCTSLTNVISGLLPATNLAVNCYRGMFQDTAIIRAPDLPAETLVSNCYRYMFNACKSLEYIKCYSTTNVSNDSYTQNWLQNAKSTGEFHYRSGTTWYRNNNHGIPNGWTPVADVVQ